MIHSQEHDEDDESFDDVLSQIPGRFIVAEEELDRTVYAEYSRYVQHLSPCQPQEAALEEGRTLCDPTASLELKREMLARLAQCGTVGAYRAIERYAMNPDPPLEQWSKIALYECRMALESELLEENIGIISTGLGGAQHRLRYIVVVGLLCTPLRETQRRGLESAWRTICERHDSLLEQIRFHPGYVMLTLLVSMETAAGTVIDESIAVANGDNLLLRRDYFVTNVTVPTDEEIQRILNEISRDETPR